MHSLQHIKLFCFLCDFQKQADDKGVNLALSVYPFVGQSHFNVFVCLNRWHICSFGHTCIKYCSFMFKVNWDKVQLPVYIKPVTGERERENVCVVVGGEQGLVHSCCRMWKLLYFKLQITLFHDCRNGQKLCTSKPFLTLPLLLNNFQGFVAQFIPVIYEWMTSYSNIIDPILALESMRCRLLQGPVIWSRCQSANKNLGGYFEYDYLLPVLYFIIYIISTSCWGVALRDEKAHDLMGVGGWMSYGQLDIYCHIVCISVR